MIRGGAHTEGLHILLKLRYIPSAISADVAFSVGPLDNLVVHVRIIDT